MSHLHPVRLAANTSKCKLTFDLAECEVYLSVKGVVRSCLQNNRHIFFCLQYTFEELLDHVQASENEVWEALEKLQSCVIDGEPVLNQL